MREFGDKLGRSEGRLTEKAKKILRQQQWLGNVRELENTIERAMILSPNSIIDAEHLAFLSSRAEHQVQGGPDFELPSEGIDLETLERSLVMKALELSDHNQVAAARLLGLTRSKFRSRLKNIHESLKNE